MDDSLACGDNVEVRDGRATPQAPANSIVRAGSVPNLSRAAVSVCLLPSGAGELRRGDGFRPRLRRAQPWSWPRSAPPYGSALGPSCAAVGAASSRPGPQRWAG
jgi:hypothetical protein